MYRDGPQSPDRKIVRNRQFQADIEEEEIEMPTHLPPDVERKSVQERIHVCQFMYYRFKYFNIVNGK